MNTFILFLILIGSAILNLWLAIYGWRRRHLPGARMFSLAAILFMVWPLVQAIDLTTSDLTLKIILMKSRIDAPVFGGIAWLVMIAQLTGQPNLLTKRHIAIISSIPLLTLLLNLTKYSNFFRHSYYLEFNGTFSILHWTNGIWFWVWFLWGYAIFISPLFILGRSQKNISNISVQQGRIVILALLLPLTVNLLFQFGITPIHGFNFTPAIFSVSSIVIAWAVLRYHLFNIVPIARGLLVESIEDGIIVVDSSNNIVDINPAMLKMIGIDMNASLGRSLEAVFAPWPDIIAKFGDVSEAQTEIAINGSSTRYFELRISPLYVRDEQQVGRIIMVHEITKYKEAENRSRLQSAALNATANAVVITDTNDVILWVNPAFTRLTGYSGSEVIGKTPKILRSNKHEPEFYRSMHETPHAGQVWKGEVINQRKDGSEYFEDQTITPVHDGNGMVTHFIAIKQDISARKQAETARLQVEAELKTALRRTETLFDITKVGISSQSLSMLLQEIVEKVAQDLPANRTALVIFDSSSKKIKYFVRGGPGAGQILLSVTYDELMEGLSGWTIKTGRPALSPKDVPDPREGEAVQRRRRESNCGSILVTPLQYQNATLGTLTLINQPEEPDFTDRDVELVEAITTQISSAIVKVTLEENLKYQNKYLATLHQITLDLLNKMEIAELLQSIVDQASEFLDAPYCEIMLLEKDELAVKAYTRNQPFLADDHVGRDKAFLSWKAFDTRSPVVMNDYSNWSQRRDIYNGININNVVSLPILSQQGSIGVLEISRSKPNREFDDFEIQAATLFAQLVSLALENAQLHEALRQESIRDHLTGLFNRRFMEETLAKELSRAERRSQPLVIVMFDMDHLKEINDTNGHSAGDEALRRVSLLLKTKIRTGDTACRYGGDEFTVILADTVLECATQRMEELRNEIRQISIRHEGENIRTLSLSIGIAQYPLHGTTAQELLKAADMALYKAKQAGRDRVVTA